MSVNRAILVGNVGKDPEIRRLQSGDEIASFSVATSESWRDKQTGERKEATEWHSIVVFNQAIVRIVDQYVKKGAKVSVEGAIKTRNWEKEGVKHYRTEIVIGRFDGRLGLEGSTNGGAQRDEHGYGETKTKPGAPANTAADQRPDIDDDIPF